jgi:hypothetical protein
MSKQPKLYPNLNPSAAIPVDRDQIFHLDSFFDQFRLHKGGHHGQYVPNSKYIFVRLGGGETLLHKTYRHPALAEGKPVNYAGEAYFDNGRLQWWSNGSGNYRPDPLHAEQAGFPMDRFFTYEDVMKGVHQRPPAQKAEPAAAPGSLQMYPRLTYPPPFVIQAKLRRF